MAWFTTPEIDEDRGCRRETNPPGTHLQLTTAHNEPDFVLSLVSTRRYHNKLRWKQLLGGGDATNWAGCMPESAQAWTNLRYKLGHDGQGANWWEMGRHR